MSNTPTSGVFDVDKDSEVRVNINSQKSRDQFVMKFPRPEYMELKPKELEAAYYIFADGLPSDEVLERNSKWFCDREMLWSLLPGKWLDSNVITSLANHLNLERAIFMEVDGCFLPATLQTLVLKYKWTPQMAFDEFQNNFFFQVPKCKKIYLPMIDGNNHFYLAVILLKEKKVHMVDSLPDEKRHSIRQSAICAMMDFIEEVLKIIYVDERLDGAVPKISGFEIIIPPDIPRQPNTFDCGMWVCNWMMHSEPIFDYFFMMRSNVERMKLALRLVLGPQNHERNRVMKKIDEHASIRRRTIGAYLDGTETADDGMRYTDKEGARKKLFGL
ncbi:hypothetical protein LINGRAHAP2_LOCUS13405 [Linum grandiflorum]